MGGKTGISTIRVQAPWKDPTLRKGQKLKRQPRKKRCMKEKKIMQRAKEIVKVHSEAETLEPVAAEMHARLLSDR